MNIVLDDDKISQGNSNLIVVEIRLAILISYHTKLQHIVYITYAPSYQPGSQEGQAYGRNYLALGLHEKGN